jgi:hypothetical protein
VHTVKTDDRVGTERYWHRRFVEGRKYGEWFDLRKEDVSGIQRRGFMQ